MGTHAGERLVKWLEQAYAMEKEAETMLTAQAGRLENYHILAQRIQQHVAETRDQIGKLEQCLSRHGASPPQAKSVFASLMASMHAAGTAMMSDEVIKSSVLSYAFEHMEIAVYESLILAADAAGDQETRAACESILQQERAMADWLAEHLEPTVVQFLQREQADLAAKR